MKKVYFLIVLFLSGLSVGNVFAAASAAAAAEGYLGQELIHATMVGDDAEVEKLIAAGADVNAASADVYRYPVLMLAASKGNADIVKLLLDAEADVNARDFLGYTALMYATMKGNADIVKLLLSKGADKTIKNKNRTAESLARRDYPKLADYIRDFGSGRLTKAAGRRN